MWEKTRARERASRVGRHNREQYYLVNSLDEVEYLIEYLCIVQAGVVSSGDRAKAGTGTSVDEDARSRRDVISCPSRGSLQRRSGPLSSY